MTSGGTPRTHGARSPQDVYRAAVHAHNSGAVRAGDRRASLRSSVMPYNVTISKLTVEGHGTFDVPDDKRLVLAIEQDAKVDVLHACGGNARCTTCRVEFIDGEPTKITAAESSLLEARNLTGVRLSCQILCDQDMTIRAVSRLEGSGRPDPGGAPAEMITPPPDWQ